MAIAYMKQVTFNRVLKKFRLLMFQRFSPEFALRVSEWGHFEQTVHENLSFTRSR